MDRKDEREEDVDAEMNENDEQLDRMDDVEMETEEEYAEESKMDSELVENNKNELITWINRQFMNGINVLNLSTFVEAFPTKSVQIIQDVLRSLAMEYNLATEGSSSGVISSITIHSRLIKKRPLSQTMEFEEERFDVEPEKPVRIIYRRIYCC